MEAFLGVSGPAMDPNRQGDIDSTSPADDDAGDAQVICGAVEASCRCGRPPHPPEEPHECVDTEECGGSWRHAPDGGFEIIRLPSTGRDRP
jgi:hypothetical protein